MHMDVILVNLVHDEVIAGINMLCAFPTGSMPILFQQDGTLIILVDNCVIH